MIKTSSITIHYWLSPAGKLVFQRFLCVKNCDNIISRLYYMEFSNDILKAITETLNMTYIYYYSLPLGRSTISSNGKKITGLWFDNKKHSGNKLPKDHKEKALPIFDEEKNGLILILARQHQTLLRKLKWIPLLFAN